MFSWTLSLFRFIDWLLELPAAQETLFWRDVQEYEEEQAMPYVTSVERIGLERGRMEGREEGREEGRGEGLREALRRIVRARFGAVPEALERRIVEADRAALDQMLDRVSVVQTVDDL